ncbi:MAG: hypothetical protein COZ69_03790 [Deltaproteobacteria bacterium CG_4_8_14_3_um_filter_45_9]|nr:MAG: hypothetical protein COS40_09290 [Deltaproteobacteria bacterium CG03_land_8_20_14_0_80_45_14]PIX25268.1 MAG: hypothetical protein COZ69_03790 [Deltaproteobacteria bacterium CG_4_8_14_3_um_filter_45_9]
MRPPHNKLITGRTSLTKGACPEKIGGGQAHKGSRLRKRSKISKGTIEVPFEILAPRAGLEPAT